jgi:Metallo-peptidase family M12B Reprolysin-like
MSRTSAKKAKSAEPNPFQLRGSKESAREAEPLVHVFGKGVICDTDSRGYATPRGRPPIEIVVDASEGFIPLWAKGTTLRWRFQERSIRSFEDPAAAKAEIRMLLGDALLSWGDSAPVKFVERDDAWDFEIVVRRADDCNISGCVLASAFFPDAGRHELLIYPKMFSQSRKEQVDTLIHEIGHVFGLRHFFANVSETAWPSEVFGAHKPFTIMNYGAQSELTADDKADLKRLYQAAWIGMLTNINGTPIRLVKPFHTIGDHPENMVAVGQIQTVFQPQSRATYTKGSVYELA